MIFRVGSHLDRRQRLGDPGAQLRPVTADPDSVAAQRLSFARAVLDELERRKRRLGVLSFDDLLSRLATALEEADAPARDRMRRRWRFVLVDEFQDTDPVQWQVIDRAFSGHADIVLIGDPKQAIYAFRGGDVVTYLTAARTATTQATLGTNWRSDQALVDWDHVTGLRDLRVGPMLWLSHAQVLRAAGEPREAGEWAARALARSRQLDAPEAQSIREAQRLLAVAQ